MTEWFPRLDRDLCTGCGDCIAVCPTGALALVDGKAALVFPDSMHLLRHLRDHLSGRRD